ncbi:asparaginyl-tRNA ligase [Candidatus Mycoplasma haematolamae str. Purdue]|uniref:Asparagine--tRNA ligase n=1 Tax=Mycoplasma haematolamae (strain Purdue) TaxID=1212765 RepID=I7C5H9_MYCHA|nr:asparagine--tRNA ligase [Candidatus Mycoplasma haematolamae]AFO51762.1 asparaginyl-tRNA ligase [Candidatus Mycoplasma haematolamae str. Purdue]
MFSIKELLKIGNQEKEYTLQGWVKSLQRFNSVCFISLNDGSSIQGLQVVTTPESIDNLNLSLGSAIEVTGKLVPSKGSKQSFEFKTTSLNLLKEVSSDFPLAPSKLGLDYLRSQQLVRHRTSLFHSVYEIRRELTQGVYTYFYDHHFYPSFAPILTGNSCEGGSELFSLTQADSEFFKHENILLSVSGQFYCEAIALGLKNSFSFGPTFRAEKSNSVSHLAEFWMIEAELAFCDLEKLISFVYDFFIYLLKRVLENCRDSLLEISKLTENSELISKLEGVVSSTYKVITYDQGVEILAKVKGFEWGENFGKEDEQILCKELGEKVVFVTHFPSSFKPFYMTRSEDQKTTFSFDMLVEGIGELAGGSQRESDFEKLSCSIKEAGIKPSEVDWYLKLREYGYHSSAGFGAGFERLLMFVTGLKNIKDLAVFPRSYGNLQL